MPDEDTLTGHVALVVGGATGIGRAAAIALARHGAKVVIADVNADGMAGTAEAIRRIGGETDTVQADVNRDADMAESVARAVTRFGGLNIAVNVAGGGDRRGPISGLSEEDFDLMIGLNLKGTFLAMRHQLSHMRARKAGGAIVNIASTAGLKGFRDSSLYAAAKHGVIGLTRCAALDYAADKIRINAVCPGAVQTAQFNRVLAQRFPGLDGTDALAQVNASQPMGRVGTPEDVAGLIVWLAGKHSAYMTGQALTLDGGSTL